MYEWFTFSWSKIANVDTFAFSLGLGQAFTTDTTWHVYAHDIGTGTLAWQIFAIKNGQRVDSSVVRHFTIIIN